MLAAAFEYWRSSGFPYYSLSDDEVRREFMSLCAHDVKNVFARHHLGGSVLGLRLANHFHPQMWSVRVSRYRSPMEVFESDELLRSALQRAWRIWPDRFGARASSLRRMLKSFPGTATVSNFRPKLSKPIVTKFSVPGATVMTFS